MLPLPAAVTSASAGGSAPASRPAPHLIDLSDERVPSTRQSAVIAAAAWASPRRRRRQDPRRTKTTAASSIVVAESPR
jgi:hypothetical protein